MLENIAYIGLGFAAVFFALESAWHFTACKVHDKSIKPCFYKQVGLYRWPVRLMDTFFFSYDILLCFHVFKLLVFVRWTTTTKIANIEEIINNAESLAL